jgi:hypothetical protein
MPKLKISQFIRTEYNEDHYMVAELKTTLQVLSLEKAKSIVGEIRVNNDSDVVKNLNFEYLEIIRKSL